MRSPHSLGDSDSALADVQGQRTTLTGFGKKKPIIKKARFSVQPTVSVLVSVDSAQVCVSVRLNAE
jgi:hypothetical protein